MEKLRKIPRTGRNESRMQILEYQTKFTQKKVSIKKLEVK